MTLYRTIVADPPWRYTVMQGLPNRTAGTHRRVKPTAEGQYATMPFAAIRALPVQEMVAADAHLYLWITNPMLYGGRGRKGRADGSPIDILEAWGFEYVTLLTWHKLGPPGMGFYFRGDTEHVIFGVRGRAPIVPAIRERNWFAARKGAHSAKPDLFYEMVERVSPGPYLELFARRRRYGWDVLGNEAPDFAASQAEMGLGA